MLDLEISELSRRETTFPVSPPEKDKRPVFSIAISAGMADSWNSTEQAQEMAAGKVRDIARLAGWDLAEGYSCLDVVQSTIMALEDLHFFNAGRGASANEDGVHLCDAAIMGGPNMDKNNAVKYGGVVGLQETKNPIKAARAVLDSGRYGLLTGGAGDGFAARSGCERVKNSYFNASGSGEDWQSCTSIQSRASWQRPEFLEGVGVVVMDSAGQVAAGVSTGGTSRKRKGKKDDSSLIFAGLMVDRGAAVVCTGAVDELLKHGLAGKVCAFNKYSSIEEAATQALLVMAEHDCQPSSVIAVDCTGKMSIQSSGRMLLAATCSSFAASDAHIYGNSAPVTPSHILKCDQYVTAGLTRYPVCNGHTIVTIHNCDKIVHLEPHVFSSVMETIRGIAMCLSSTLEIPNIGLATDGTGSISILPLHGIDSTWVAESYNPTRHSPLLGYLTSRNGPELDSTLMDVVHGKIADRYPMAKPSHLNWTFYGKNTDTSYYAQVIRGNVLHYRIWEDEGHVAFLDPCGGTNGTTVLVPRKNIEGDIFSMNAIEYTNIIAATHTVARLLKTALIADKVGVFFEGFGGAYASVKLVPVNKVEEGTYIPAAMGTPLFYDRYPGYLTTTLGARAQEFDMLTRLKRELVEPGATGGVGAGAKGWFGKMKRPESLRRVSNKVSIGNKLAPD